MSAGRIPVGVHPLLLAVSDTTASIWTWAERDKPHAPLADEAEAAWRRASWALSRSLPLAWASIRGVVSRAPVARPIAALPLPGCVVERTESLEGGSFGLSFALDQAGSVLGLAPPDDLAASAVVEEWGALSPVDGLADKARILAARAPHIRHLLVAAAQREGVEEAEGFGIEVIFSKSVSEALGVVFPGMRGALTEGCETPDERRARIEAFFRLALDERVAMVDWTPVAAAAEHLLGAWGAELEGDERYKLRYAWAVARRHQGERVPIELPETSWVRRLPSPLRQRFISHLVQHAADTGSPDRDAVRALASLFVPEDAAERFPAHLKILGALARLDAAEGRFMAAAEGQLEIAGAFLDRGLVATTTFQLSELFRLAAALDERGLFERAEGLLARAERLGDLDEEGGRVYIELAHARAGLLFSARASAVAALGQLTTRPGVPFFVAASALRWLISAEPSREVELRERFELLAAQSARHAESARRARALMDLDAALRRGERPAARLALAQVEALEGELVGRLRGARDAARWPDEADYIARLYPY